MKRWATSVVRMDMKLLTALLIAASATASMAQDLPQTVAEATRPIRIKIRHADPWMVKAMLEGAQIQFPEMSTILAIAGAPAGTNQAVSQASNAWFVGGKLIVNPTDNSIWFIPDRR